ncbi:MAG: hypothetical protein QOD77_461 [Thermoplasmata archaeon]|jgi:hypothetical protein|nr:hypothetical protein [Thermoplasmata archaeon]
MAWPAALLIGAVAVLCGIVAVGCWRAVLRTGNRRIQLVAWAFALLAAKNLVKAAVMASGGEDGALELAFSLADLAAVGLIAYPILRRPA